MHEIHPAAATGFTANATGYARGRPDYPLALDAWLRDEVGLREGSIVVDLGAGTGKFLPRLTATGATPIAVEPVAAMLDQLRSAWPGIQARQGTAEAIPLADASVDAVVCAQAFHWFATEAVLAEIHRVLKPGGTLALVWNVRDESVPWVQAITDLMTPLEGDTPRYYLGSWRQVFPAKGFTALVEAAFPHVHVGPPEEVIIDRFLSVSFIAALPASARHDFERRLRAVIEHEPTLAGRATVAVPYRTVAYRCSKDGRRGPSA